MTFALGRTESPQSSKPSITTSITCSRARNLLGQIHPRPRMHEAHCKLAIDMALRGGSEADERFRAADQHGSLPGKAVTSKVCERDSDTNVGTTVQYAPVQTALLKLEMVWTKPGTLPTIACLLPKRRICPRAPPLFPTPTTPDEEKQRSRRWFVWNDR